MSTTRREARKKWDELFPKIDTDKDNSLSRDEKKIDIDAYIVSTRSCAARARARARWARCAAPTARAPAAVTVAPTLRL